MVRYVLRRVSVLLVAGSATITSVAGQSGYSGASAARTRAMARVGVIPAPSEISVTEFLNYHKHQLPKPRAGEAVALDLRWRRHAGSRAVLQLGFTTVEVNDRAHLPPLNVCLVIDKSGSMSSGDKMGRVVEGLQAMAARLRPSDTVSVVTYDNNARVVLAAERVGNGRSLRRAIRSLSSGGSTNLHRGLMLGYREVRKHFDPEATNRVILLTDGIANEGVTDPEKIVSDSGRFNESGIDLSTIGVGYTTNQELLKQLAESGRGLHHFIADDAEIRKVFVDELQSLVAPVARDAEVEISWPASLLVDEVYGAKVRHDTQSMRFSLNDMNHGLTQVVLVEFSMDEDTDRTDFPVDVAFRYTEVDRDKRVRVKRELSLPRRVSGDDHEVRKNWTIARLAQGIRDLARAAEYGDWTRAERIGRRAIRSAERDYPTGDDEDIARVMDILKKYRRVAASRDDWQQRP